MNDGFFVEEEVSTLPFDEVNEVNDISGLNYIQQAIKKYNEPLQDGITYDGVLTNVDTLFINSTPVLRYTYTVNQYEVSNIYFFSVKSTMFSIERLSKNLKKFGFDLKVETAVNGLDSIVDYTKHLIGSKVKIIQNTRKDGNESYFNYEIVEVLKKD